MKVNVLKLKSYLVDVLSFVGMPEDEAKIFSDILVQADQRGVKSHGVMRIDGYVRQIERGRMKKKASHTVVVENPVLSVWDAQSSCAHVISHFAMLEAIRKAKNFGIAFVGVRNSNHFGAGAYYSKLAADQGMIAIVSSTASPTMAPWGGKEKLIGNNPLALSAPTVDSPTVTLDMAQSTVAFGRIDNIRTQGIPNVPEGWAFDKEGNPTTKTDDVYSVVPIAGYKGFGLAFFIDIISGMLIGGNTGARCANGPSHSFLVMDPVAFGKDIDAFKKELEDRIAEFKACPKKDGVEEIFMPGEIEENCFSKSQEEAEIIDEVVDQLNALAERLGVEARL